MPRKSRSARHSALTTGSAFTTVHVVPHVGHATRPPPCPREHCGGYLVPDEESDAHYTCLQCGREFTWTASTLAPVGPDHLALSSSMEKATRTAERALRRRTQRP